MKGRCHETDELARLVDLATGHPDRGHLNACPRCQALAMALQEFLHDRSKPAGANLRDAEERLLGAFAAEQAGERNAAARERRSLRTTSSSRSGRAGAWLRLALARPVLAVLSLVALGGALYLAWPRLSATERLEVLRSAPAPVPSRAEGSWLLPVGTDPQGFPVLRWRAQPDADAYVVHLFGSDLSDAARFGPQSDTVLALSPAALSRIQILAGQYGWQVEALRAGRPFRTSSAATVRIP